MIFELLLNGLFFLPHHNPTFLSAAIGAVANADAKNAPRGSQAEPTKPRLSNAPQLPPTAAFTERPWSAAYSTAAELGAGDQHNYDYSESLAPLGSVGLWSKDYETVANVTGPFGSAVPSSDRAPLDDLYAGVDSLTERAYMDVSNTELTYAAANVIDESKL